MNITLARSAWSDNLEIVVDGKPLEFAWAENSGNGTWTLFCPSLLRECNGQPKAQSRCYSHDEVISEVRRYIDFVSMMRDRDHATAIIIDRVQGDPLVLADEARETALSYMHAAGILMNQLGEDDPRFDALRYTRDTSDVAAEDHRATYYAIRNGQI